MRSRQPNVRRLRRKGDLDRLKQALHYRETNAAGEDSGVAVRVDAALAMVEFRADDVEEILAEALGDPDTSVRLAAADAIESFGRPMALDALADRAGDDDAMGERAIHLMASWESGGAARRLVERLLARDALELEERHRRAVQRLLDADPAGDAAREGIAYRLVASLQDRTAPAGGREAQILGWLGMPASGAVLEALGTDHPSPAALRAAGEIGDARAVEPILMALSSPDAEVRVAAATAAGTLNHTQTVGGLLAATQDSDRSVRDAATAALDRMGTAAVITALVSLNPRNGGPDELVEAEEEQPAPPAQIEAEPETAAPAAVRRRGGLVDRLLSRLEDT